MNRIVNDKRPSITIVFIAGIASTMVGCQSSPFNGFSFPNWGAPTKVTAPSTGSFQAPGSYNGSVGTGSSSSTAPTTTILTPAGGIPPNGPMQNGFRTSQLPNTTSPLVGSITNAQNQLQNATINTRNTVQQGADQLNNRVEQASARIDRFSQGVVQASQILSEAATLPVTPNTTGVYADRSFAPSAEGIPGTNGYGATGASYSVPVTTNDPNAQWRSPGAK